MDRGTEPDCQALAGHVALSKSQQDSWERPGCWAAQHRAQCVLVSSAAPLVLTRLCGRGVVGAGQLIALPVPWEPASSREKITQSLLCGTPGGRLGVVAVQWGSWYPFQWEVL